MKRRILNLFPQIILVALFVAALVMCTDDVAPVYIELCDCDTSQYHDCFCDSLQPARPAPCLCDSTEMRDCYCDTLDPKPVCECDTSEWRDCDCDTWDLPLECDCDTSKYHDCWCDEYQPDTCRCDTTPYHDCDCDYFQPEPPPKVSFSSDIQPILNSRCVVCHNEDDAYADFTEAYAYSYTMDYVKPGNPEKSEFYKRSIGTMNIMPPSEPYLTEAQIQIIYQWILQGAQNN